MNWVAEVVLIILLSPGIAARQNYSGNSAIMCDGEMPPESALYSCKGEEDPNHSCRAFLIFTATFPYNTVAAIAALTSSDQSEIMKLNNVTRFAVFREDQEVVIPVNCSCSGRYYQATTTYQIGSEYETYHTIANVTFQGLSTCNALRHANVNLSDINLQVGDEMGVPLRCACPTREQAASGTNFLLTYPIGWGDTLYQLSEQFSTSVGTISEGNGLPEKSSTIYPFTTILIPMQSEPSRLHTVTRRHGVAMPPLPVPVPVSRNSILNRILSIGGIVAGVLSLVVLMILVFVFLLHKRRRQVPPTGGRYTKSVPPQRDLIVEIARLDHNLRVFKFFEIKKATGNFAARNRISRCIYRATFKRKELAVKKSRRTADNEVKMLHQINHFNIVKLHGFCENKDDLYLIYEYMENGSLHDWISGRGSKDIKSWNQLIRIALDVANGLLYLHKFTNPARVHNNISSSNILLDGNLRAKIANFSLAITDSSFTTRIAANKGYIAPECLEAGPVTPKVDIFAFGVILLELVTGKGPVFMQDGKEILLSTAIAASMESLKEVKLSHFIDSDLHENGMEYAIHIIKLSSSCLSRDSADRPDMVEVVSILQKLQFNIQKPLHKAKNSVVLNIEDESSFSFSTVLPSM